MAAATSLLMAQRTQGRRRETGSHDEHDDPVIENVLADQPELNYLKQHYRAPVQAAIVAALEALPDRDRVLLRLHLSEGMSIDRLGAMYAVNRATAARWLAAARRTLLQSARAGIQKALRVSDTECDSILKLVRSQLDLSITAHLRSR
jgi:RNA polymerase sigma-70 factor (ECF subfamily)